MVDEQKKRRRFYTWSASIILGLLLAILLLLLWLYFNQAVTDTNPMPLPAVALPEAELRQLQQRVDSFRAAVRAHRSVPPLALTSDEVNALLATDPDGEPLKDHFYVTLQGNEAKAQFSFPTAQIGLEKGRFLNGSGTFSVGLRNEILRLNGKNLIVKRHSLPKVIAQHFENKNLAEAINANPRARAAFKTLESIEVKDGKLVITPKKQ